MIKRKKIFLLLSLFMLVFAGCSTESEAEITGSFNVSVVNNLTISNNATNPVITEDYIFNVALGNVPNAKIVHKFGRHSDVSTTLEPVSLSGNYRTPTTAMQLQISSNNANDNVAGTGARKVKILGLNSTWQEQEIEVSLNGLTPVTLPINFTRVYRAFVTESGTYASQTASSHLGVLTIEEVTSGDDWAIINVEGGFGLGQTQIGVYTIEKGCTGHLLSKFINVDSNKASTGYFFQRQEINRTSAPFNTMRLVEQEDGITGGLSVKPQSIIRSFPELTDLGFMAKTSVGTASMSVDFELLLVCDHAVN